MARQLRYSNQNYNGLLQGNGAHNFAHNHAMQIYDSNAVYSFIPKNACSTMRLSIAMANGCIHDIKDFNWIHQNNHTFKPTLKDLATADYTFVILRNPIERLISCYMDKIVNRDHQYWALERNSGYTFKWEDLSFRRFVSLMQKPNLLHSDAHWKPQLSFLVYDKYDDYFTMDNVPHLVQTLKNKIGLTVYDARPHTGHGLNDYERVNDKNYADISPLELFIMKQEKKAPIRKAFLDDGIVNILKEVYKADFKALEITPK